MHIRHYGRSLIVHTPAKVNLFLEILGKRSDGYHELETLMVSVDLYDTLRFREESSETIQLQVFNAGTRRAGVALAEPAASNGESRPAEFLSGRDNLVLQAADLLRKAAGVQRGARIDLFKRIPVAAGLAGGSSDAAATLSALNCLWKLGLSGGELQTLGAQLGSDVGFFLSGTSAAVCRGRGERIEPLGLPLGLHFVIGCPAEGLSTALVYDHCQPATTPRSVAPLVGLLTKGRLGPAARQLYNALQAPSERFNHEVTRLKEMFSREPVLGHIMSGSGSAYFGLCAHRRQARSVAGRMRARWTSPDHRQGGARTSQAVYVVQCRP